MRERKKTGVHGTLEMIPCKFNAKQLLCKTLDSRMNIIETRAVLILSKKTENGLPTNIKVEEFTLVMPINSH